jgi:VanZ family protein
MAHCPITANAAMTQFQPPSPLSRLLSALLFAPARRPVWRTLLALLLLVILCLALVPAPPKAMDTGWDKANHLLAFGSLAFCAFCAAASARGRWLHTPVGLLGYGVLIELAQSQLPPRSADARDVLADAMGIALGLAVAAALRAATGSRPLK